MRKLMLKQRHLSVYTEGESRIVIRSAGRLRYAVLMVVCLFLVGCILALCSMLVFFVPPQANERPLMKGVGAVCGLVFLAVWLAMFYSLVSMLLAKRTTIDLDSQVMTHRHLPGFARTYAMTELATVNLLMVRDGAANSCFLAICDEEGRVCCILHWQGGYRSPTVYRDELLSVGRIVARFLNKPLESSAARLLATSMSWVKVGPVESIAAESAEPTT